MRPCYTAIGLLILGTNQVAAQSAVISESFGDDGVAFVECEGHPPEFIVIDADPMPDGGLLLTGQHLFWGSGRMQVFRFDGNGMLDPEYAEDGSFISPDVWGSIAGLDAAVLPDGSAILSGCRSATGDHSLHFIRLAPDGTIDPAYGDSGIVVLQSNMSISSADMLIAPDGSVYVTGIVGAAVYILHLEEDGSFDTEFGEDGLALIGSPDGHPLAAKRMAFAPSGYLVVSGSHNESIPDAGFVAVLDMTGTLADWFGNAGFTTIDIYPTGREHWDELVLLNDGRLLLSGNANTATQFKEMLLMLEADGSIDTLFGVNGEVVFNQVPGVNRDLIPFVLQDGSILMAGWQLASSGFLCGLGLVHVSSGGTVEMNFGTNGNLLLQAPPYWFAECTGSTQLADGRIILSGQIDDVNDRGIGAMAIEMVDISTQVDAAQLAAAPSAFPNPTAGEVFITNWGLAAGASIELRATDGSLKQAWTATNATSTHLTIDGEVANGTYMLRAEGADAPKATIVLVR